MIDSDNKNALDNYGVWVKKSPKDIPSEDSSPDMAAEDSFDIAADLPDFSSIDDQADNSVSKDNFAVGETSLTSEELLNITDNITETDSVESGKPSDDANKDGDDIFDPPLEDTKDISDNDPFDISFDDSAQDDKQKGGSQEEYELPDIDDMLQENSAANPLPTFDDIELTDEVKEETKNEQSSDEDFFADIDFNEKDDNASGKSETIDIDENIVENADTTDEISWENDIPVSDEDTVSTTDTDTAISTYSAENFEIPEEEKIESEKPEGEDEDIAAEHNTFVPDIFDEETASFTDEVLDHDVKEDQPYAAPPSDDQKFSVDAKDEIINRSNAILEQIQKELLSLQNEISSLKNDFAEFKNGNVKPERESVSDAEKGGFFSDIDEDETISLSGDELNNIMNNADFTEEQDTAQAPNEDATALNNVPDTKSADEIASIPAPADDDLSIDFDSEQLEEPSAEDLKQDENLEDSEIIPEEMSVPKIEDVLVESSSVDLIDSAGSQDSSESLEDNAETSFADINDTAEDSPAELDSAEDFESVSDEKDDASAELPPMEDFFEDVQTVQESGGQEDADLNTLDELYPQDPPIADALTEDTLNYLNKDSEQEIEALEETAKHIPPSNEADSTSTGIPQDLTKDIKAVLSYMDQLLENLPDEKISEFARSEQFVTYKKLFTELGLA
ncbi:hypothetical protein [Treponema parvum]|uniref:hypothetical protein n=1 Tax=Treponema parvum TaxID=138851 RepID=UPI001AEBFB5F|nr:hypothetical protein [Treponema parvum]QTQ16328.1 hypothetical protein HXT04_06285 [Treponema parvum]